MNHRRSWFYVMFVTGFCLSLVSSGFGQAYPETLWIPVTFYDYEATGYDFAPPQDETCNMVGVYSADSYKGMVLNKLGPDKKPVKSSLNLGCATYLNNWFRPSGQNGRATNTEFYYDEADTMWKWTNLVPYKNPLFPNNKNEFVSTQYNSSYPMRNIVIYDSLPFIRQPSLGEGYYQFSRSGVNGEPEFFWIDGKGYGNNATGSDGKMHNFYFAMELHWEFTYKPGLTFDFRGDDAVWAFVEDSLVMDLGGFHSRDWQASFQVDNFASRMGLTEGEKYSLRLFYAERGIMQSTIRITTNLLPLPQIGPVGIRPASGPNRTSIARQPALTNIFDLTGRRVGSIRVNQQEGQILSPKQLRLLKGSGAYVYSTTVQEKVKRGILVDPPSGAAARK